MDLWCHTTWQDPNNAFSFLAPTVQYGPYGAALTLETLGQRWRWEKTKVWRFFQKHGDVFTLHRLPGSFGCLIFNTLYPSGAEVLSPSCTEIERILKKIRILAGNTHISGTDNLRLNKMIRWHSRCVRPVPAGEGRHPSAEDRVSVSAHIIRAYFSLCWNCKHCVYDCGRKVFTNQTINVKTACGSCARIKIREKGASP